MLPAPKALLESIGKVPVVCAPAPGFIVPRLQALVMAEAARMVEEGVATPEDIDKATRFGFGFRYASIGVVEFIDYGGNDILYYACRYLSQALGERYTAPAIVERMMQEGRNGLRRPAWLLRLRACGYGGVPQRRDRSRARAATSTTACSAAGVTRTGAGASCATGAPRRSMRCSEVAAAACPIPFRRGPASRLSLRHVHPASGVSLTQVLGPAATGRVFFEEVIRENLDIGRPDQVQLYFRARASAGGTRAGFVPE